MGFYEEHILPWLIDLAMRNARLAAYRSRVVPAALGRVLEVGIGSGLNLPFYGTSVSEIVGIEPSHKLLKMIRRAAGRTSPPLKLVQGTAEDIPMDDRTIDTAVTTWTVCSIRAIELALYEMRHQTRRSSPVRGTWAAPEAGVRWWQDQLTPAWRRFSGGCHLNRLIPELIRQSGFRIEHLDMGHARTQTDDLHV
jgi:hypothetical protein